jgi:hypothetical protein
MIFFKGTSSTEAMAVASVPPDIPPFSFIPVMDCPTETEGPTNVLIVLLERKADMSEGIESKPHEGTMIAPVFVA